MVRFALQSSGWILARLPQRVVAGIAWLLGGLTYALLSSRRRLIHSNLQHAFPERSPAWRRAIARECVRRFVETALLSLATPHLDGARMRHIVRLGPGVVATFDEHRSKPFAAVIGAPHFAHWECQTAQPLLAASPTPEYAAIYRPIDNPSADAWIKKTRERFGMRLLSRREGFAEAVRILRRNGFVGILYDQNAGNQGSLTLLLDRVCSTTELPGMLATRCGARVFGLYPRYLGFWRVQLEQEEIGHDGTAAGATIALNMWIERLLRSDDNICASWLWGHQRWKNQDAPAARLKLEARRNLLGDELRIRDLTSLPRRTRIWLRMPNWLGDVVMTLPLLRAMRASRPDAEITLLAKPPFVSLLEEWKVADRFIALPPRGMRYFAFFLRLRPQFPDCHILFTQSIRADVEAWLCGARQRFGILRRGAWRPLLTHTFVPPADFDEAAHHQFDLWSRYLASFGLDAEPDLSPFKTGVASGPDARSPAIGLIAGSENTPAKRWPVSFWKILIETFPEERFILFGTMGDRPITQKIAQGFGSRVTDLAGQTSLPEFSSRLRKCRVLVANDTGGMHLANALGVPVIALFGPTNPVRTRPVFSSWVRILQPPGSPPAGGGSLADLTPAAVASALREMLGNSAHLPAH